MSDMKRREFIALLGSAAAVWPFAAGGQQPPKTAKVGILYPGTTATLPSRIAALREGLRAAGYREPDNVELLPRAAEGDPNRIAPLAMELAERKVDVHGPCQPGRRPCRASGEHDYPSYRT
jgi:putative ABC transport system substrate-binding protein